MKQRVNAILMDFVERAAWTAGQAFLAVLLATGGPVSGVDLPWGLALTMAGGAALGSLITTGIQYLTRLTNLSFWPDLFIRLAKTFLSSLLGSIGAGAFNILTFDWSSALDLALITTLASLGKGLLSRQPDGNQGDEMNPSTLHPKLYALAVRAAPRRM
jgi:hypothetical protein